MLPLASPHYTTSCFLTLVAFCALSVLFPGMSDKGQLGRLPHWGALRTPSAVLPRALGRSPLLYQLSGSFKDNYLFIIH